MENYQSMSKYQEVQRAHQMNLIQSSDLFEGVHGNGKFKGKERKFVLEEGQSSKNLYSDIRDQAQQYFNNNHIGWWSGKMVSGHVLSSQVACINHLFPLRNNPEVLKEILCSIHGLEDVEEVLPIPGWLDKEENKPHYIAFEAISHNDNLKEGSLTRGSNCTSIDALMIARAKKDVVLIPIEWKYTEFYAFDDKTCKKRMDCYEHLIMNSKQLRIPQEGIAHSIYFQEPFYQLMRQTLWAEQVLENEPESWHGATRFVHLHVVPFDNKDLLNRNYRKFTNMDGLHGTWMQYINDEEKYVLINPRELLKPLDGSSVTKLQTLQTYLKTRYWN